MLSVVVPVLNEEDNIRPLIEEIIAAAAHAPITEIIFVDDGSTDGTPEALRAMRDAVPMLRIIRHSSRSGQSAALWTGVSAARNDLVVTLDGDGQNDPVDIALLYEARESAIRTHRKILVAGQRTVRRNSWSRRAASQFANGLRSYLLNDGTRDTGCSLKLFRRPDYLALPYFDHMHRFLPALMIRSGAQVVHVDVSHRPRTSGKSKYNNFGRAVVGARDLLGVMWLNSRPPAKCDITEVTDKAL